jgi:DNA-binding IclR family transcriptional regulator
MATGTLVRLGRLDTDSMTVAYIEKKPGRRPVSDFHPAARLPAHACASGKILLAFAPPEIPELVISRGLRAYTSSTLTRPDQFRKSLATTRLTGIGVCCAELRDDSYAVAIPVSDWWGSVIAAMEMTAHDPFTLRTYSPVLAVAARCLSRELDTNRPRPWRWSRKSTPRDLRSTLGGHCCGQVSAPPEAHGCRQALRQRRSRKGRKAAFGGQV